MAYFFQLILLVAVMAFAMLIEPFWSWSNLSGDKSITSMISALVAAGSGFVLYCLVDYSMLDYLMLVPGANYVIT